MDACGQTGLPPLIVVIEDEAMVRLGYRMLLEGVGMRVLDADCTVAALARLTERPACILADYRLADDLTGAEAIDRIRDRFGHGIPGILVTGDVGLDRLRLASRQGVPVLNKPISGGQLICEIQRSLVRG